jgi:hypothetical protein
MRFLEISAAVSNLFDDFRLLYIKKETFPRPGTSAFPFARG